MLASRMRPNVFANLFASRSGNPGAGSRPENALARSRVPANSRLL